MARASDTTKTEAWRSRLARFETSGMKTAEFCAGEGVSVANFYAWRRKLGLTKPRTNQKAQRGAFQQVLVNSVPILAVRLPGNIRIEASVASEQAIRTIISELVRAASETELR